MTLVAEESAVLGLTTAAAPPAVDSKVAALFHEHGRFVFRLLRRLGVSDADADDVFQEVFVIVHRKLPELEQTGSLRAWVYGISVRRAANYRKRQATRREVPTDEVSEHPDLDQPSPAEAIDTKKAKSILDAILVRLPDEKREAFVLHVIEELPMNEVAQALGCPLHTAYSRFYAARTLVEDGIRRARAQMGKP